jgi:hypothetical protein
MIVGKGIIGDDQCRSMDSARLEVFGQMRLIGLSGHTVVSDERISEGEYLSFVAGIGQRFIVSDHPCVEYDLARYGVFRPEGTATILCAVFQY